MYMLSVVYLGRYIQCANVHTVWNAPGCFKHNVVPSKKFLNALVNNGSSYKMSLFQHRFLHEKQRENTMSAALNGLVDERNTMR